MKLRFHPYGDHEQGTEYSAAEGMNESRATSLNASEVAYSIKMLWRAFQRRNRFRSTNYVQAEVQDSDSARTVYEVHANPPW